MDADIILIYEKLCNKYPIQLTSSWKQGFHSAIDYPILTGTSALGHFEMFYDDVPSFAFYAMHDNREVFAHFHLKTTIDAEKSVVDFMEGKLALESFG